MAGYSGTPLPQKLGIKPGAKLALVQAPEGFDAALEPLPERVKVSSTARARGPFDVVVAFYKERAKLEANIERLAETLSSAGGLWIAWPKKASGVKSDVTEDVVRALALPLGLVDNKVCALDDVWSGLRLVYRLSERQSRSSTKQSSHPRRRQGTP